MYKCDICEKSFHQKCDYERHKSRKIPCTPHKYQCPFCYKIYKSANGVYRHRKKCPDKPEENENIAYSGPYVCMYCGNEYVHKTHMYRHMRHFCQKNPSIRQINSYGHENMSWIIDNLTWVIGQVKNCKTVEDFIEFGFQNMHFNERTLENANIKVENKDDYFKRNMVSVYKGNKWLLRNNEDIMKMSIKRFIECIEDNLEIYTESNNKDREIAKQNIDILLSLIQAFDNSEEKTGDLNEKIKPKLYMLFNNFMRDNCSLE